jgi:Arc/MetJ family transcription regulator
MQQTYFNINPQLLENALKITGLNNQDEVINFALGQLLQSTKQKKLLELEGKVDWDDDLEQLRTGRSFNDTH